MQTATHWHPAGYAATLLRAKPLRRGTIHTEERFCSQTSRAKPPGPCVLTKRRLNGTSRRALASACNRRTCRCATRRIPVRF